MSKLTERKPDAKTETEKHTYQVYENENETIITKGIKGGNGGYGGKSDIKSKDNK